MKKLFIVLIALTASLRASAQFEEGTIYAGASLSGLDLSYSGARKLALDFSAKGGYCLSDNLMVLANVGVDTNSDYTNLSVGVGGRYYIIQNGIYLGVNATLKQVDTQRHNDFMPGVEVGYAFFVNRHCTIEPAIYYHQSFKSHKDYSQFGLRIGIGIYL